MAAARFTDQEIVRTRSSTHRKPKLKPQRRLPPEVLTEAEVRALMEACKDATPAGLRNRALIAVLYRAGLRITEALSLRPIDIDPIRGYLRILHGKGDRSRTVGMDGSAFAVLSAWIEVRANRGIPDDRPLFCMLDGRPLRASYIRVLLPRLGRRAGIIRRVHAHGLRHTHAAELRGEGVDIGLISKQLGHRSIATTAKYLDHIAPWDVVRAMARREWDGQDARSSVNPGTRTPPR